MAKFNFNLHNKPNQEAQEYTTQNTTITRTKNKDKLEIMKKNVMGLGAMINLNNTQVEIFHFKPNWARKVRDLDKGEAGMRDM